MSELRIGTEFFFPDIFKRICFSNIVVKPISVGPGSIGVIISELRIEVGNLMLNSFWAAVTYQRDFFFETITSDIVIVVRGGHYYAFGFFVKLYYPRERCNETNWFTFLWRSYKVTKNKSWYLHGWPVCGW